MANQYCIYAWWGDSIAHLPAQQGFHRYIPVDFRGKIMNLSLFRATKTEQSIVMVENSVSWKVLLNNYRLSDILLSATPSALKCLLTKQTLSIDPLSLQILVHFVHQVNMYSTFSRPTFNFSKILSLNFISSQFICWRCLQHLQKNPNLNRPSDWNLL